MNKQEILEKFDYLSDPQDRDSGYLTVEFLRLAERIYFENKQEMISVIQDWLKEDDKPHLQITAVIVIRNCRIKELIGEVLNLKQSYILNRPILYLKDDIKVINETILVLETCI